MTQPAATTPRPSWIARRGAEQRDLWRHVWRRWFFYAPVAPVYVWALIHLCVNWTPSLPYTLVYLEDRAPVARGDLVVFRFEGGELAHHLKGSRFFKKIAGVPGDVVTVQGRNVFINGRGVGYAYARTLDGQGLEVIEPGVIAAHRYYVQGTHPMSFDSRYRVNGLVRSDQIIGRARVIF